MLNPGNNNVDYSVFAAARLLAPCNSGYRMRSCYKLLPDDIRTVEGLKQSMSQRLNDHLPRMFVDAADSLSRLLHGRCGVVLQASALAYAVLDEGLVHRVEFQLSPGLPGNHHFSYLGDAQLSTATATLALLTFSSPREYNELRKRFTSRESLADFYDSFFGRVHAGSTAECFGYPGPVTWESFIHPSSTPTRSQKGEFVEAVAGVLFTFGDAEGLRRYVHHIFDFCIRSRGFPLGLTVSLPLISPTQSIFKIENDSDLVPIARGESAPTVSVLKFESFGEAEDC